jgi:hypothetical protein
MSGLKIVHPAIGDIYLATNIDVKGASLSKDSTGILKSHPRGQV